MGWSTGQLFDCLSFDLLSDYAVIGNSVESCKVPTDKQIMKALRKVAEKGSNDFKERNNLFLFLFPNHFHIDQEAMNSLLSNQESLVSSKREFKVTISVNLFQNRTQTYNKF